MGFCFPEESTKQFNFERVLQKYLKRWEIAVQEDNAISLNQQRGVRSMFRVPGRFSQLEFATHNMNNWLIGKMVNTHSDYKWDPGARIHIKKDRMFSNDDEKMTSAADHLAQTNA